MQDFSRTFQSRLGALRREWERRSHTLRQFNPHVDDPLAPAVDGSGVTLLLAGSPGPELSAAQRALEDGGITVARAPAPERAANLLGHTAFDAMIVAGGESAASYRALLAAMKMHSRLNGLPVLAVTPACEEAFVGLARLGVTVSAGPAGAKGLRRWVRDAILHKQMALALSQAFIDAEPEAAGSADGIFCNRFARTHMETLLTSPTAAQTCLALFEMAFSAINGGGNAAAACRAAAVRRLSALAPAGVMVADAPAGRFWLLFPEAGAAAVSRVLSSAAQSLRARPVTCAQGAHPVEIYPRFRTLTAKPGDNVPAFLQRCGTLQTERPFRSLH